MRPHQVPINVMLPLTGANNQLMSVRDSDIAWKHQQWITKMHSVGIKLMTKVGGVTKIRNDETQIPARVGNRQET